jgi:hypothetical protein
MTYYDPEPPIGPTQLERIIRDLQKEVELLKKGDPKNIPWTAVPLINGWTHWNGASNPAVFCRLNGIVHIQGVVNGSAATSNQLAILPAGCRPLAAHYVSRAQASWSGGATQVWMATLDGNGIITRDSSGPGGSWHTLDFHYVAEQ